MSGLFESIKKGLEEAIAYSEGRCPEAMVHEVVSLDVGEGGDNPVLNAPRPSASA